MIGNPHNFINFQPILFQKHAFLKDFHNIYQAGSAQGSSNPFVFQFQRLISSDLESEQMGFNGVISSLLGMGICLLYPY